MANPITSAPADIRNDGHRRVRSGILAGLALLLAIPAVAAPPATQASIRATARWSAGVKLGRVVFGKVAVDPKGNALAAWADYTVASKTQLHDTIDSSLSPTGQAWQPIQVVPPSRQQTIPYTTSQVQTFYYNGLHAIPRFDRAGNATVVYAASTGIWSADRPAGRPWQTAQLLIPDIKGGALYGTIIPYYWFKTNVTGDAVLLWGQEGGNGVYVRTRPLGGQWSAPVKVAAPLGAGHQVDARDVAVSPTGAAVITWEDFTVGDKASGYLHDNYQVFAATTPKLGTAWTISPALDQGRNAFGGLLAMDASNRVALVVFPNDGAPASYGIQLSTLGGTWGKPVYIAGISYFNPSALNDLNGPTGVTERGGGQFFATDDAGHASLLGFDYRNNLLAVVDTQIGSNSWSQPVDLPQSSRFDGRNFLLDVNAGGFGVITWTEGNRPGFQVRASARSNANAAWGVPKMLATPTNANNTEVVSIAINPANQGVAAWRVQDGTTYDYSFWVSSLGR